MLFTSPKKREHVLHHHLTIQGRSYAERVNQEKKQVAILGESYSGFPLACVIAGSMNYTVFGVDIELYTMYRISTKFLPANEDREAALIRHLALQRTRDFSLLRHMRYVVLSPRKLAYNRINISGLARLAEIMSSNLQRGQIIIVDGNVPESVIDQVVCPVLEKTGLVKGSDFEIVPSFAHLSHEYSEWSNAKVREVM